MLIHPQCLCLRRSQQKLRVFNLTLPHFRHQVSCLSSQQREEIAVADAAADDVVVVDTTDTTQTDAEQAETDSETVRRSTRVRRPFTSSYMADVGVYEPVALESFD